MRNTGSFSSRLLLACEASGDRARHRQSSHRQLQTVDREAESRGEPPVVHYRRGAGPVDPVVHHP